MTAINGDRLLADLHALAKFGACGTGVDRTALSPQDIAARRWLVQRLQEAGLDAAMDRFGSVLGRDPGARRTILIGSHSDTVPKGGWLDGALGTIYALEIARSAREHSATSPVGVDVVSFQDEEGTFLPFLGSLAFCGMLHDSELAAAREKHGQGFTGALDGLAALPTPHRLDRERHVAFLEGHIEQGPRLEAASRRIGVVTSIIGIRRYLVKASGTVNHAGTTPMAMRQDAGAALIRIAGWVHAEVPRLGSPDTVWNIGGMTFRPGAVNVVPGQAEMLVEFRDSAVPVLERLERALSERVAEENRGGVTVTLERTADEAPAAMADDLIAAIEAAAATHGHSAVRLTSGAGHDAQILARVIPAGMLFIPSIGGISHDVRENSTEADIVLGCEVLADAAARLREGYATRLG